MTIYHVIITKTGVMNILAESEQEAREIAEDMDKKGTFDMDTLISVEESWSGKASTPISATLESPAT